MGEGDTKTRVSGPLNPDMTMNAAGTLILGMASAVMTSPRSSDLASCVDNSDPTRRTPVEGTRFMVAGASPFAVQAGCDVLKAGGSAIDAGVAMQAVLAVVEPQSSGLAGGAIIAYWDNRKKRVRVFEGLSVAPNHVTKDLRTPTEGDLRACGLLPGEAFPSPVSVSGRAFGVPGVLRVLEDVHRLFGRQRWNRLFSVAIRLAEDGFSMPPYLKSVMASSTHGLKRCGYSDLRARYCNGDTPKPVGSTLFNAPLAQVLREVRDGGADAFYDPQGTIAPAIIERVTSGECRPRHDSSGEAIVPSLMTLDDFATYRSRERNPICLPVLGYFVCTAAPPAFGGVALLQMLKLAERGGVRNLEPGSLAQAHLLIESSRLAQFDRRQYLGDPDSNYLLTEGLLDARYVRERFQLFSRRRAIRHVTFGNPPEGVTPISGFQPDVDPGPISHLPNSRGRSLVRFLDRDTDEDDATSHISIVDAEGNALSMTTTNNTDFGSQLEARGMILNNALNNFTVLDDVSLGQSVNAMGPRKKPRSSMAPALVFDRRGRLRLVVGSSGGGAIPDYVAQVILGVMAYQMDPQQAINLDHVSGQAIAKACGNSIGPRSELERGTDISRLLEGLHDLGHPCPRLRRLRSGSAAVHLRRGKLFGAADRRRDGIALGE